MTGNEMQRHPLAELLAEHPDAVAREVAAGRAVNKVVGLLAEAIEASGSSQREIADALGVTAGRVSQVLSGDGNLYISTLARYLSAMGYQLDLSAIATSAQVPEIGRKRRQQRRRGGSQTDQYDTYIGLLSHNDTHYTQVMFIDSDAPREAELVAPMTFVGQVKSPPGAMLKVTSQTQEIPVAQIQEEQGI